MQQGNNVGEAHCMDSRTCYNLKHHWFYERCDNCCDDYVPTVQRPWNDCYDDCMRIGMVTSSTVGDHYKGDDFAVVQLALPGLSV